MTVITKEEVEELANVHRPFCISIYISTHRVGKEVLEGKDVIRLKNQLKGVSEKLENQGLGAREIQQLLQPVEDLVNDWEFWRYQSDGLAIFLTEGLFMKFKLPVNFREYHYVSGEFYLEPLMPIFNGDGRFYLLTLKKDGAKLYEETRYSMQEIDITGVVPSQLEDTVGYDFEQKSLQFRTQEGNRGQGMFHGHGAGKAEDKNELLRYFRAVDKGIMTLLHADQHAPLVLACIDFYFPVYREATTHNNLFPEHLSGSPDAMNEDELHQKAWDLMNEYFDRNRKEKIDRFLQFRGTGKATSDVGEIIPAALNGKVDTLFIQRDAQIFGVYDQATAKVDIQDQRHPSNVSLINLAAVNVFLQQGKVFIFENGEMPDGFFEMNALFRYSS